MKLDQALMIAQEALKSLEPHCTRIAIAGSVRRRKPEPKDIEIVCIPIQAPTELFGGAPEACQGFCNAVAQWPAVKGRATGRYTQRLLPQGIKLDLFMADVDNWGWIMALRTGPADFSAELARRFKARGNTMGEGRIRRYGQVIPMREESDVFDALGIDWIPPEARQ